jgi:hypothetical protein
MGEDIGLCPKCKIVFTIKQNIKEKVQASNWNYVPRPYFKKQVSSAIEVHY